MQTYLAHLVQKSVLPYDEVPVRRTHSVFLITLATAIAVTVGARCEILLPFF